MQHIKVHNILVEQQLGFRPATSIDKASSVTYRRHLIVLTITSY
jgi:hypothetical protein